MTELQQNRYDQLLRRVGDLKGGGSKVSEVLTELFPVIDVENVPGELLALTRTTLGVGSSEDTAGAGEVMKVQLFNPVGSGMLITCTSIFVACTITENIRIGVTFPKLADGIGTETRRDTRAGITARTVGQIRKESTAGVSDANMLVAVIADQGVHLLDANGLFVIAPGTGITVGNATAQKRLIVSFMWRERIAEPSELNF